MDKEVDAVRDFLMKPNVGVDFLNKEVSMEVNNDKFTMKFASIFCHKKPIVQRTDRNKAINPGSTPGCELGDLFVLFLLMDGLDNIHYSAGALFQAKMDASLNSSSQRYLYDDDDGFTLPDNLYKSIGLKNVHRYMPTYDEGRGRALRYLILKPSGGLNYIQARLTPWSNNYLLRWSSFLDGLISGTDGVKINFDARNPNSWGLIAKDLLWMVKSVPPRKKPRGNNEASKIATKLFNDFTNYKDYSSVLGSENNDGGVSVMLIIAHAPKEYKEDSLSPFEINKS
ncbi:hypothetical protein NGK10_04290 [Enterobacter quasiroggenkampii]|uniref:hypothetical protein n=1 Tax=Enterobacter quasiroggenkampii TaxID=2497436 RepID=UPI002DC0529C|nr:hypothetical protein [Enterobacter quasiroggenkampii]MEB7931563.1 hypothetical protein [Enterobacter quasiroggenkampii]